MKRFYPRAVPEALALSVFLVLGSVSCAPKQDVKPGAPVLSKLSILEPSGNKVDLVPDTAACTAKKEGDDCDPGAGSCTLAGSLCYCTAKDMCDPTIVKDKPETSGTLGCTYAPMSVVIATFDRLLDTAPFLDADGNPQAAATGSATSMPTSTPAITINGDYRSNGSPTGLVFPMFFGFEGPIVTMSGSPGFPTESTVATTLDGSIVRAKDGKTAFVSAPASDGTPGALDGAKISFKTGGFSLDGITVPAPPPPMDMGGGGGDMPMGCPGTMTDDGGADGGASDAGPVATDAGSDAGSDAAKSDAAAGDAAASDGGAGDAKVDASADGGVADASTDVVVTTDAAVDASAADGGVADAAADKPATDASTDVVAASDAAGVAMDAAATGDAGASDAATTPPPSTDVPADMNMGEISIAFNNPVPKTVLTHIKLTEDGKPFTAFNAPMDDAFPTATVKLTPKTTWAAGKTYVVTVDKDAADVFGAKTGAEATASFTMSK